VSKETNVSEKRLAKDTHSHEKRSAYEKKPIHMK